MLRERFMPSCENPALLEVQEDSYDSSGAYREKGITILETAYGGKIDPLSGEDFNETGRDWDLDHYYPKSKANAPKSKDNPVYNKEHFERLWNMTFEHLPENLRPAPDPNCAINLRFCERNENIRKGKKTPSDVDLIKFWQTNYQNILRTEIELMAKLALGKFQPSDYGIMDERALAHFGDHERQAYHIHRVYEAIGLAISLAEKTGKVNQAIAGFQLSDHMSHVRADPSFPSGDALREGKIRTAHVTLHAFDPDKSPQEFQGSIITVDEGLKSWFKRYEIFAQEAIPSHLSKTLADMRMKMAYSPSVGDIIAAPSAA